MKHCVRFKRPGAVSGWGVSGSATSASKVMRPYGVRERRSYVWIDGEGWVKWSEIERDVRAKFEAWRIRKAQEGIFIRDGIDMIHADIDQAMAARSAKKQLATAA